MANRTGLKSGACLGPRKVGDGLPYPTQLGPTVRCKQGLSFVVFNILGELLYSLKKVEKELRDLRIPELQIIVRGKALLSL